MKPPPPRLFCLVLCFWVGRFWITVGWFWAKWKNILPTFGYSRQNSRGKPPISRNQTAIVALSPIIMEVESYPKWKETNIGGTHFPLPWLWEEGYGDFFVWSPRLPHQPSPADVPQFAWWPSPCFFSYMLSQKPQNIWRLSPPASELHLRQPS